MQQPLQITFRGLEPSDAIERRIRTKAEELERFEASIVSCHVTVDSPHQRRNKGNLYSVHVDIRLPDTELFVRRERHDQHAHEDVYVAIRDAFRAAVRQLEDYARRRRGEVKQHDTPLYGVVTQLFPEDGYGFLEMPGGTDVYFHENSVVQGGFSRLRVGDEVRVVVPDGEGEKGPQASTVVPLGKRGMLAEPLIDREL